MLAESSERCVEPKEEMALDCKFNVIGALLEENTVSEKINPPCVALSAFDQNSALQICLCKIKTPNSVLLLSLLLKKKS